MNKVRRNVILGLLVFLSVGLQAQHYHDVETWWHGSLSKKVTKKWTLEGMVNLRFNQNSGTFKQLYVALEPTRKLNKFFKIGGQYRYVFKDIETNNSQRLAVYLIAGDRVKPLNWSSRLQYQYDNDRSDFFLYGSQTVRWKATLEYQRKKKHDWVPFVGGELFYRLEERELRKYRLYTGLSYEINKRNRVKFRYVFQQEVNRRAPLSSHIVHLSYAKKLRKRKKKKKD